MTPSRLQERVAQAIARVRECSQPDAEGLGQLDQLASAAAAFALVAAAELAAEEARAAEGVQQGVAGISLEGGAAAAGGAGRVWVGSRGSNSVGWVQWNPGCRESSWVQGNPGCRGILGAGRAPGCRESSRVQGVLYAAGGSRVQGAGGRSSSPRRLSSCHAADQLQPRCCRRIRCPASCRCSCRRLALCLPPPTHIHTTPPHTPMMMAALPPSTARMCPPPLPPLPPLPRPPADRKRPAEDGYLADHLEEWQSFVVCAGKNSTARVARWVRLREQPQRNPFPQGLGLGLWVGW